MPKYFKYIIANEEPIRIADDSRSQSGQTETMHYITGSTIRGLVISTMAADDTMADVFAQHKSDLFSAKTQFLNAYPAIRTGENDTFESFRELIPAPMGFYANKGDGEEKEIQNVVALGTVDSSMKRARIGDFAYIENGCVYGASVKTGSDLKIKKKFMKQEDETQSVFRNQYIERGYSFAGYIVTEDDTYFDYIKEMFRPGKNVYLGNGKSAGSGRCRILCGKEVRAIDYPYAAEGSLDGSCYMMLLSDTVMRNSEGEYCGLDLEELQGLLGVSELEIERCATSMRSVRGYNSTWKTRIPSVPMYLKGSVFLLKYSGTISLEKALEVMDKGIGIRRNEGFGRILFLKGYEDIRSMRETKLSIEKSISACELSDEDMNCLQITARASYMQKIEAALPEYIINNTARFENIGVSSSVLGTLEGYTTAYHYQYAEAKRVIDNYLGHAYEKQKKMRVQKLHTNFKKLKSIVDSVLDMDRTGLEEALGISGTDDYMQIPKDSFIGEQELGEIKLTILTGMIRYYNKKKMKEA